MPQKLTPIPLADPLAETLVQRADILAAITGVIESGRYILGPKVTLFEESLSSRIGTRGAVGVASGTDALALAMLAAGVEAGDEVITVSHTAGPTVAAIRMIGATPVLVDVIRDTYCIDPTKIAGAIGPRTKAIIAVHLYGHPADMDAICAITNGTGNRRGEHVAVIEDCAQAVGAKIGERSVGSFGTLSCFSFYPTKHLGAIGDGGAVCSNDAALLDRLRKLRLYGWDPPQYSVMENGRCTRLDELQAAILSVKLTGLSATIQRRRAIAQRYLDGLGNLPLRLPHEREGYSHAYHLFVVRSQTRDALETHLAERNIATGRHYPFPVHRQPGLAAHARIPVPLAVTERIAGEILSLPMFATMTDAQVDRVVDEIRAFHR